MLKRDISTVNVLIASAGSMIGSGWLFSPFICAQIAGSNALISWIIGSIFMLFIALPLCELGAMFPVAGGLSNYPSYTHGKEVGFIFAWIAWLSYVAMTPIEIQAIIQYASHFFPNLIIKEATNIKFSAGGYILAVSIMLSIVVANSFGIKLLAECNKYASIFKFLMPAIAIACLIHVSPSFANIHIDLTTKQSWEQIFSALSLGGIAFAFTGFQNGLILAGEVRNPQRNIPIAIIGAVLIGFLLYFMLQFSFIVAIPKTFINQGWHHLAFPGDAGPLVGLTLLLGLVVVAALLMFDAAFSPLGTTLVYTAATSRILYGMAENQHFPAIFLKLNRYKIPYIALAVNFIVGVLSFLPFPGWQKMVAFLSSASILSYGVGPICLLALRKLQPKTPRPFKLRAPMIFSYSAFYICNLMLYWCSFQILWKLCVAVLIGIIINFIYQRKNILKCNYNLYWFLFYLGALLGFSYLGTFGGIGVIQFPLDVFSLLPFSIIMLNLSQRFLVSEQYSVNAQNLQNMVVDEVN